MNILFGVWERAMNVVTDNHVPTRQDRTLWYTWCQMILYITCMYTESDLILKQKAHRCGHYQPKTMLATLLNIEVTVWQGKNQWRNFCSNQMESNLFLKACSYRDGVSPTSRGHEFQLLATLIWRGTKLDTDLRNIWTSSACVWALLSQYPFPRDCCWHCVAGLQKLKIFCDSANLPGWWLWQSASPKTLLPAQECLPRYFVTFMYVTPSLVFADLAKLQKMEMTLYWWCFTDLLSGHWWPKLH